VWWRGDEIATHISTSDPAAIAFIQAIRTLAIMMREKKDAFGIFLELEEPKSGGHCTAPRHFGLDTKSGTQLAHSVLKRINRIRF